MKVLSLGKVPVPVPGTPVSLAAAIAAVYPLLVLPAYSAAMAVAVRTYSGNTGKVYVGEIGLVAATGKGLIAELLVVGANGQTDACEIGRSGDGDLDLSALLVDAAVAGEGPLVTVYL